MTCQERTSIKKEWFTAEELDKTTKGDEHQNKNDIIGTALEGPSPRIKSPRVSPRVGDAAPERKIGK